MGKALLAVVGVIIIVLVLVGALVALKIVKLPSAKTPVAVTTNKTETSNTSGTGYGCILTAELCGKGEIIFEENKPAPAFYGLGYSNVSPETPIKAAISGTVGVGLSTSATGKNINTVSIRNEKEHIEADYMFSGKPFDLTMATAGKVTKGDIIGWVGSDTITFRKNPKTYNVIFFIMDTASKTYLQLAVSDLK